MFLKNSNMSEISDNNKITHKNYCKKIYDMRKFFFEMLIFKFFETVTIFKNYFLKSGYFIKIFY